MTIVRGEKQVGGHHRIRFPSMARGNNNYCHPLLALIQKVSRQNFFNNIHLPRGFPTVIRKCIQRASIVPNRESIPEKNGVTETVEEWRRGGSRPALLEEHFSSSPPPPTPLPTLPPALHLAHLLLHLRRPPSLPMLPTREQFRTKISRFIVGQAPLL